MSSDTATPQRAGHFLPGDAPPYGDILNCMHCGLCLPTCPTYTLTGSERSSPRGRIQLMRGVADGKLELTPTFAHEMFFCLGCLACETACPAGVDYGGLLEAARTQVVRHRPPRGVKALAQRLAFGMFENLALLRLVALAMRCYQASGLRALVHRTGLLRLLGRLGEMEGLMPTISVRPSSATVPVETAPVGPERERVGVLLGCVMDVAGAAENEATVRLLARHGCRVIAPPLGCCGALHAHAGDLPRARRMAKEVIAAFEAAQVDCVVLNSAGCGAAMKEYGHWLHDDPVWAERAAAFAARVLDLTEFLTSRPLAPGGRPLGLTVTYHDACHLNHAQKVNSPPRKLLQALPGVRLIELPEAGWCCGSAGIYNITHFPEAVALLDRKMANIAATGADLVVTGNPGCLVQLQYGVRRHGLRCEAIHTATLLDRIYGGSDG
ncbi:MAG: (Fe-S)-binding protein [Fimbriimonadaceae bacterium]|nr:(Fe-S)-binding protein [Fimbriimonadaceae bacterium]